MEMTKCKKLPQFDKNVFTACLSMETPFQNKLENI